MNHASYPCPMQCSGLVTPDPDLSGYLTHQCDTCHKMWEIHRRRIPVMEALPGERRYQENWIAA